MRVIIATILTALLLAALGGCRSKRDLVAEVSSTATTEHTATASTTLEELLTTSGSSATDKEEEREVEENVTATIVAERLDTSGRVVERMTAIITTDRSEQSKKKEVAEASDTATLRSDYSEQHRDTTIITNDTIASVEEEIERGSGTAGLIVAIVIIAILSVLWRLHSADTL